MKLICITPQEGKHSLIYLKPDTALLRNNEAFYLPDFSEQLTGRLALVIKIKKMGKKVAERFSHRYYDEITVGLNIEALDIIERNKKEQLPWDEAVSFDYSAPIGPFIPKSTPFSLTLQCNRVQIQEINTSMINIDQLIAEASSKFTLKIGDFIYITLPTEGQKLEIGQELTASLNGEELLKCSIK